MHPDWSAFDCLWLPNQPEHGGASRGDFACDGGHAIYND
jgi:hypothetical protein